MKFLKNIYEITFEGIKEGVYEYRFISEGEKNITKVITFRPIQNYANYYNLGFGNLELDANGYVVVNDESLDNNKDHDKVLSTVFSSILNFIKSEQTAKVVFIGNTEHKHTTYKRKLAGNLEELKVEFNVLGGFADYDLVIKEVEYITKRNGKKVKKIIKSKEVNSLNIRGINGLEQFDIKKSRKYDFVLLCLK